MEEKEKRETKIVKKHAISYLILVVVFLTAIISSGVYAFIENNKNIETGSVPTSEDNLNINEVENEIEEKIENLTSVENINSVEELQKLNEKEVEETKEEKNKENKKKKENASTPKYYIKVNYKAQVVTVYTKDSNGKYTKPVKAMVCSTGTYTPTSGVYKIPNKFRWLDMIGDVYAQYCTQIVGNILFHSVPYAIKGDNSSLFYKKYDQLGTKCSLGCIRLTCADAKWIYDNCKKGTQVEFYSSSNPGPLGKPSARKISSAPSYVRGWDPTDPAKGNPWNKYLKQLAEKENNKKNEETQKNEVKEPEILNEVNKEENITNEIFNEVVNNNSNELKNEIVNEEKNETSNTTLNEEVNEGTNEEVEKEDNKEVSDTINATKEQEVNNNNAVRE